MRLASQLWPALRRAASINPHQTNNCARAGAPLSPERSSAAARPGQRPQSAIANFQEHAQTRPTTSKASKQQHSSMSDPPAEQLSLRNPSTHTARTNLALSLSSSLSEGSEACAVREMTRSRSGALPPLHCYGRLDMPEQLGEETLEEDEVDDEDLATGEGPGVPGEERRRTTL